MQPTSAEFLTKQFYDWEMRGRGWKIWPEPVDPEPPFRPFWGHAVPDHLVADDGQAETWLSRLGDAFLGRSGKSGALPPPILEEEPAPEQLSRGELVELHALLPPEQKVARKEFEQLLLSLSLCREPVTFELVGEPGQVTAQFVIHPEDSSLVRRQLQTFFPGAAFLPVRDTLLNAWGRSGEAATLVVEFGLAKEFILPLATVNLDPYLALVGALSEVQKGELGLFQVMFAPVRHSWAESGMRAVTDNEGGPFFANAPELVSAAQLKVSRPLYAAVVRVATRSTAFDRAVELARHMAGALRVFSDPAGNELIPLTNDEYQPTDHARDVLCRQTCRSGMLLNLDELVGLVHLPSPEVNSPQLRRLSGKTKAAPLLAHNRDGLFLGLNRHVGETVEVRLAPEQRVRHMHVVGASGTGKSTLLFNLIRQDIENGEGVALLDPHGDLVERILGIIPPDRIDDVILVDPADEEFPVGFNILSAHSNLEKNLLASDLVSVFQRLSTSWGDQMGSVLNNAILAFLESSRGGTLADLRRFLLEPKFRNEFLTTVCDPDIVYYWRTGFPQLSGNKSIGPVLTRLETFLSPKPIHYMVSQPRNRLDFGEVLDTGKIFLAKLSQGQIGKENAFLLGSLFVAKFQQVVMSRQRLAQQARRDFWLYVDEFQQFITPSMAEILTGARKYRLGFILAHQELRQLQRDSDVAGAVMSNPYTRIVFRVGDADARALESGFSTFEARNLQNLGTGEAVCRVERSDFDFNLIVPMPVDPDEAQAGKTRERVIAASRARYATPKAVIEEALQIQSESIEQETEKERPAETTARTRRQEEPQPATPSPPPIPEEPQPKPSTSEPKAPAPPPDLGRGGAQHQAIQKRLKHEAEALGFRATIEKEIPQGSVDLALEKAGHSIACEISITTTIDHEFGNVVKCLKAGFTVVAVVSGRPERLKQIAGAVQAALSAEEATRVCYFTPDDFIAHLRTLVVTEPSAAPAVPSESVKRGYKVRRKAVPLTPDELKAREAAAVKAIAEAMRKKKSP